MRPSRGPWLGLFARQLMRDVTLHVSLAVLSGLLLYVAVDTVETGNMAKNTEDAWAVLELELVTLPVVFQQFAGMAVLIGTSTALAALVRRGEVVAMFGAGAPPSAILRPLLLTGLAWALAYAAVTEYVAPWSHAEMARLRRQLGIGSRHTQPLRGSRNWFTGKDRVFRVQDLVDARGERLAGVLVLTVEAGRLLERWDVERLEWAQGSWTAHGVVRRRWPDAETQRTERIARAPIPLAETPEDFVRSVGAPERMAFAALSEALEARRRLGQPTEVHALELYRRATQPLTLWLAMLAAAGLVLRAGRRPTLAAALGYGALAGFTLWVVDELSVALATTGALGPRLAAALPAAIALGVAARLWGVAYRRGITD